MVQINMNLEGVRRGGGDDEFLIHPSTPISIYILNPYKFIGDDEMALIQCACGCGTWIEGRDKRGRTRRYVYNHHRKGKHLSEDHLRKLSDSKSDEKHYLFGKHLSEETKQKIGEQLGGINNPMYGKHHSKETKQKLSDKLTGENHPFYGKHHSEETLSKIRENHPDFSGDKNPNYGKVCSEKTKVKISESLKMFGMSGEKNPNWKGGISFFPYCTKFNNALKEEIRDKFGRKCFLCPKTEEDEGRKLSVHHVDYNKEQGCNGVRWLLVPLCMSCNGRANFNREYWQDFITEKLRQEGYI